MLFQNRDAAAMKLLPYLRKYAKEKGVVLAVPRGGVPIGYPIARAFGMPLELLLTKKIGHPWMPELAIGAVSLEGEIIDNRHNVPDSYIQEEIIKIRQSLKERYKKFMGNRPHANVEGKTVIIVDDGVATGNTILAAIRMIRLKHPKKIVVAVPVAPIDTAATIRKEVDELICLYSLDDFIGVGLYYNDFTQVTDEEVIELLKLANHTERTT